MLQANLGYNRPFAGGRVQILIVSDIHSNLEALDACLNAAPAYELAINLGDIVGYGASPNEVTEHSRKLGKHFVRGNHDKAVAGLSDLKDFNPIAGLAALWTREKMTPENMEWLRSLPQGPVEIPELPGFQFVHGSPVDEDEYVVTMDEALGPLTQSQSRTIFFGHTHLQGGFYTDASGNHTVHPEYQTVGKTESCELALQSDVHYMINPGSVGQPRDGDWRAAFATFDTDTRVVSFHRVPYDLKSAQEKIMAANLPPRLATRLAAGK
jgi:diadenosine tetraphosphatase ApaH/serine/threonine PP2A family protein phosphatase